MADTATTTKPSPAPIVSTPAVATPPPRGVRQKSYIPPNESKEERFRRLAAPRMTKALRAIKRLGNLAGYMYSPTPDNLNKMEGALREETQQVFARLRGAHKTNDTVFTF